MEKVIVITGASGGLGSEMARYFAERGYCLALHCHSGDTFSVACEHEWFRADLTDESSVAEFTQAITERFGRVDVLINNAGISRNGMSWKLGLADWNEVMAINLTAPFLLSAAFLPHMRERKFGRIISISSVVAQTGVPGTAAYAASKAGLLGLTKTLAKETASSGITVNALALGYFDKGMISEVSEPMLTEIVQSIPKKKLGEVKTILKTLEFLLSEEADYITGQTINVNGGMFAG